VRRAKSLVHDYDIDAVVRGAANHIVDRVHTLTLTSPRGVTLLA
jgi:hypothetical protein